MAPPSTPFTNYKKDDRVLGLGEALHLTCPKLPVTQTHTLEIHPGLSLQGSRRAKPGPKWHTIRGSSSISPKCIFPSHTYFNFYFHEAQTLS